METLHEEDQHQVSAIFGRRDTRVSDFIGFRGAFVNIEGHNGHDWVMIGTQPFARVFDASLIAAFWAAYNQGLAVARKMGRQGI